MKLGEIRPDKHPDFDENEKTTSAKRQAVLPIVGPWATGYQFVMPTPTLPRSKSSAEGLSLATSKAVLNKADRQDDRGSQAKAFGCTHKSSGSSNQKPPGQLRMPRQKALKKLLSFLKLGAYLNETEFKAFLTRDEFREYAAEVRAIKPRHTPADIKYLMKQYLKLVKLGDRYAENVKSRRLAGKTYQSAIICLKAIMTAQPEILKWLDRNVIFADYESHQHISAPFSNLRPESRYVARLVDSKSWHNKHLQRHRQLLCDLQIELVRKILTRLMDSDAPDVTTTITREALAKLVERKKCLRWMFSSLFDGNNTEVTLEENSYLRGLRHYKH